jgi:hypothetical protein
MASEMTIQVETGQLISAMSRFARETGQTLKAVYEDQIRLASNSLARAFPAKAMAIARKAVLGDLENIFIETGSDSILQSSFTVVGSGTVPAIVFRTKNGAVLGADTAQLNPWGDMEMMKAHHEKYRSKTTGRATKAGAFTRDIGRWKYINRQIVGPGMVKRYAAKVVFPRLGMLKSGWMLPPGAPKQSKVPAWVEKASKQVGVRSQYTDQMDMFASGFLKLSNLLFYAKRQSGLVLIELQKRQRDLKSYAGKRLQGKIDAFNRRAASGQ